MLRDGLNTNQDQWLADPITTYINVEVVKKVHKSLKNSIKQLILPFLYPALIIYKI